jgi:hypothetical protein
VPAVEVVVREVEVLGNLAEMAELLKVDLLNN